MSSFTPLLISLSFFKVFCIGYHKGILERWTQHVLRGTGALVVISVLDFLTFALCAPYSETTDGAHFDALLALIAKRGKELFRLLQHPSLSVIKG